MAGHLEAFALFDVTRCRQTGALPGAIKENPARRRICRFDNLERIADRAAVVFELEIKSQLWVLRHGREG